MLSDIWKKIRNTEQTGDSGTEPERLSDEITQPLPVMEVNKSNSGNVILGIRAAARTDSGRVRRTNEDDVLLALPESNESVLPTIGIVAIADGMGGHDKGEVASRTAIEATINHLQNNPFFTEGHFLRQNLSDDDVVNVVREAVQTANRAVYRTKVEQSTDMGTTLVLALILRGKSYIANVGDSRAYIVRDRAIRRITEDHSLVERMIAAGQITEIEARRHPQRNLIFRSLGTEPVVEIDMFVEPLSSGDRLLLCSDGLNSMISDDVIADIVSHESDVDRACRLLIRAANDAGGADNISVALVEMVALEDQTSM